jgi:hypothetical protein
MTDAELREAANFVVGTAEKYLAEHGTLLLHEGLKLACAWLAEHPADDGEAIDAAWLKAAGFDGDAEMKPFGPGMWLGDLRVHHDWRWSWRPGPWPFRAVRTRGDLRRLAAALGIPLREG